MKTTVINQGKSLKVRMFETFSHDPERSVEEIRIEPMLATKHDFKVLVSEEREKGLLKCMTNRKESYNIGREVRNHIVPILIDLHNQIEQPVSTRLLVQYGKTLVSVKYHTGVSCKHNITLSHEEVAHNLCWREGDGVVAVWMIRQ